MVEEMCAEAVSVGQEVAVAELEGVLAANNEAFLASIASPPPLLNIGGQTMPCVDGRSLVCAGRLAKFYRCAAPRTPKALVWYNTGGSLHPAAGSNTNSAMSCAAPPQGRDKHSQHRILRRLLPLRHQPTRDECHPLRIPVTGHGRLAAAVSD